MASHVFYNSINQSTTLLPRTHFPKDSSIEFVNSVHYKFHHLKITESGFSEIKKQAHMKASVAEAAPSTVSQSAVDGENSSESKKKVKVLVVGGEIGGLAFLVATKKKGFEMVVFERDLIVIRGEGQYRDPIQIESNALAALEAIDLEVADGNSIRQWHIVDL